MNKAYAWSILLVVLIVSASSMRSDGSDCSSSHGQQDCQTEMARMAAMLVQLQSQIDELGRRVGQLEDQADVQAGKAESGSLSRRIQRSTQSKRSESSWAKLQIAPDELGSMPYGHYRIGIYGHLKNSQQATNETKRFFYAPAAILNYTSASSVFNNVTQQTEFRFRIEMWNDLLEEEAARFTASMVGHSVYRNQISVLPMDNVRLSSRVPPKNYEIPSQWIPYQRHQYLTFSLICQRRADCEYLAMQMRTNAQQFDHLKLFFSLSSATSEQKEMEIRIDNIARGELMAELLQRFPKVKEVLLTAADEKRLMQESLTQIIVKSFDDSIIVSDDSDKEIRSILDNLLVSSHEIIADQKDKKWESVFWNEDNFRPDKIAKTLNEFHQKLDKDDQRKMESALENAQKTAAKIEIGGSFGPIGFGSSVEAEHETSKSDSKSLEEIKRLMNEGRESIEWNGEKFVPKQISLSRINLAKVRDRQSYQNLKVKVSYTKSMLPTGVNIAELSELPKPGKIPLPGCLGARMPGSCRDLSCAGHKLNGFYPVKGANGKVKFVFCNFASATINSGFEKLIGNIDVKTTSMHFHVRGSSALPAERGTITWSEPDSYGGNAMNPSTGIFTAPVNGIYRFVFKMALGLDWDVITSLMKGKKVIAETRVNKDGYLGNTIDAIVLLKKGDKIQLEFEVEKFGEYEPYVQYVGWLAEEQLEW